MHNVYKQPRNHFHNYKHFLQILRITLLRKKWGYFSEFTRWKNPVSIYWEKIENIKFQLTLHKGDKGSIGIRVDNCGIALNAIKYARPFFYSILGMYIALIRTSNETASKIDFRWKFRRGSHAIHSKTSNICQLGILFGRNVKWWKNSWIFTIVGSPRWKGGSWHHLLLILNVFLIWAKFLTDIKNRYGNPGICRPFTSLLV